MDMKRVACSENLCFEISQSDVKCSDENFLNDQETLQWAGKKDMGLRSTDEWKTWKKKLLKFTTIFLSVFLQAWNVKKLFHFTS